MLAKECLLTTTTCYYLLLLHPTTFYYFLLLIITLLLTATYCYLVADGGCGWVRNVDGRVGGDVFSKTRTPHTSDVFFKESNNNEGQENSQQTAAANLPAATWADMQGCELVWCTRWGNTGLSPLRPLILFTSPVSIPPGRYFVVKGPA